jgi:hypothetical protein
MMSSPSVCDSQGKRLNLFDIVVIENIPSTCVDWDYDISSMENILDCQGRLGMIVARSVNGERNWVSKDARLVNLWVPKFSYGKWGPLEIELAPDGVKKLEKNCAAAPLFTLAATFYNEELNEIGFPINNFPNQIELLRAMLAAPPALIEELSDYLCSRFDLMK